MNLHSGRNKFLKLFESKGITLPVHVYHTESDGVEKSEQKFEKSIAERVKLRRQKADDKTDDKADNDDKKPDTTDMPHLESEESAAQRTKQKGQGVKVSTPPQILCRLPIPLAQLKPGNNSQKLKNEIRQLSSKKL